MLGACKVKRWKKVFKSFASMLLTFKCFNAILNFLPFYLLLTGKCYHYIFTFTKLILEK